jgi:hypothetical protein
MSDYLGLFLSSGKEPAGSIGPRLPSIFEPLPLNIRWPRVAASEEARGTSKNGAGAEVDGWESKYDSGSEGDEGIGKHRAVIDPGIIDSDHKTEPLEARPRQTSEENGHFSSGAILGKETDLRAKTGAVWEKPEIVQTAKIRSGDLSMPLPGSWKVKSILGDSPDPSQLNHKIEDEGIVSRIRGKESGADRMDETPLKQEPTGRFLPMDASQLKLVSARLKEMALPKAEDRRSTGSLGDSRPVIKVTIGRVEVKAVTKSQQARQNHRPEKSRQSLEDYLKQRRGGN